MRSIMPNMRLDADGLKTAPAGQARRGVDCINPNLKRKERRDE
jgi:hypothetical protein